MQETKAFIVQYFLLWERGIYSRVIGVSLNKKMSSEDLGLHFWLNIISSDARLKQPNSAYSPICRLPKQIWPGQNKCFLSKCYNSNCALQAQKHVVPLSLRAAQCGVPVHSVSQARSIGLNVRLTVRSAGMLTAYE